jgi:hypothetical protein
VIISKELIRGPDIHREKFSTAIRIYRGIHTYYVTLRQTHSPKCKIDFTMNMDNVKRFSVLYLFCGKSASLDLERNSGSKGHRRRRSDDEGVGRLLPLQRRAGVTQKRYFLDGFAQ